VQQAGQNSQDRQTSRFTAIASVVSRWNWFWVILVGGLTLVFFAGPISRLIVPARWSHSAQSLEYGLDHLGVVLVVAMLVRATLERATQREFVKVVNDRVKAQIEASIGTVSEKTIRPLEKSIEELTERTAYTITTVFEPTLQTMLKESVLNPAFIRPKYLLHLKLIPLDKPTNSDLLKVFVSLCYELRNVTTESRKYSIESWLDDIIQVTTISEADRSRFTRIAYGEKDPPRPFDINALIDEGCISHGEGMTTLQIKDVDVEPNSSLYVAVEGLQLMRNQDHFVWNLITLTKKLEIIVELSGGLTHENFDVFPREMHHIGHEAFQANQSWKGDSLNMSIDQVLLPYQGIEIRWSPRPPQN